MTKLVLPVRHSICIKHTIDFMISLIVVLTILPILCIVLYPFIKMTDGPLFFSQIRIGKNGKKFRIYKFRTMSADAEALKCKLSKLNEADGPAFKMKNDPRITKIGSFLRKTNLDEFPQFVNVLLGDMSIIGPRPPVPQEVEKYKHWHSLRLSMKPGITCLWQVMPHRNSVKFDDWLLSDLEYINHWSLRQDLVISIKTLSVIIKCNGQ